MRVSELREALDRITDPDAQVCVFAGAEHSRVNRIVDRSVQLGACVERVLGLEVYELPREIPAGDDCDECARLRDVISDAISQLERA